MKIVSPRLEELIKDCPETKKEEARESFGEFLSGVVQSLMGNVRQAFVDQFLDKIGPLEKAKIEFIADQIIGAKDSNRMRKKTIIGLAAAFESGINYAVEAAKRGENPSNVVEAIHRVSLQSEAEKITKKK